MKTYSVKQIAESLGTNPETVRRWIRSEKLKAVQVSRKNGNLVSESELKKFLERYPRYLSRMPMGMLTALSPTASIISFTAGVIMSYYKDRKQNVTRIRLEDLKEFLAGRLQKLNNSIEQKEALIKKTQDEITVLQDQVRQYEFLIEHEDIMKNTIKEVEATNRIMEE